MEIDLILADIILNELGIPANRINVYSQNYKAPSDPDLFVIISTEKTKIVGSNNRFDDDTQEEVKSVVGYTTINIELTSKDREALERKEEILMALTSNYSLNKQEENSIKIMRNGDIMDLSFVEESSSLHRFRIPVIISHVKTKRTSVEYYENFRTVEVAESE